LPLIPIFMPPFYTTTVLLVFLCLLCAIHVDPLHIASLPDALFNSFTSV
jgi:hypothetical protein